MSVFLRWLLNALVKKMKGRPYVIDSQIDGMTLIAVVWGRLVCLIRGLGVWIFLRRGSSRMIFIGARVDIRNARFIIVGKGVTIGAGTVINGLSREGVSIGENVSLGQYVIIEATGVLTDLGSGLTIGKGSGLGAYSFIGAAGGVHIGENVIMGQRISFHSENHNFGSADLDIKFQGVTRQGIRVGNNCWVGANAVFLDGCEVGEGCVIAAGSVLRGKYPANSLIAGAPANVKRSRLAES